MTHLKFDQENSLYFEHARPGHGATPTFVFVNALTGNTEAWEACVAPRLREQGFGTLSYNFRGQDRSTFGADVELTADLIVDDLKRLLEDQTPANPILVGLSIGGLYAAQAVLQGASANGLVLLNTLREIGPRIAWINDAMAEIVGTGGVALFLDVLFPLLVNPEFAAQVRENFLQGDYQPLDGAHGHMNLMRNAVTADWDIPYEQLALPTRVITGLQDRVFLDTEIVARLFARLPDAKREDWPDAGHLLPLERPEALAASLERFAQELAGPTR